MPRIYDEDFIRKIVALIKGRDPENLPVDLVDDEVTGIIDLTDQLANFGGRLVQGTVAVSSIGGTLPAPNPTVAELDLFASDPSNLTNANPVILTGPGGAGIFSAGGFLVGANPAGFAQPTRIDLVYFTIQSSVPTDLWVGLSGGMVLQNVGKALSGGAAPARSSANAILPQIGTYPPVPIGQMNPTIQEQPGIAANTPVILRFTDPAFSLANPAAGTGIVVLLVNPVANQAHTVKWACVWRQIPTP